MATKLLKSVKGRRIRITRLDANGAKVVGACSSVVTDGFVSVTLSNELEAGQEYSQKNAWGDFCVNEKDGDLIKWVNVGVQLCNVDPNLMDIIGGAHIVTASTNTIGATFGSTLTTAGFGIEVWTRNAQTGIASPIEWGYFVVPWCKNGQLDGDLSITNEVLNVSLKAEGYPAPASWGVGPYSDNPLLMTGGFPTGDLWGVVTTTVQPPAITTGCAAVA